MGGRGSSIQTVPPPHTMSKPICTSDDIQSCLRIKGKVQDFSQSPAGPKLNPWHFPVKVSQMECGVLWKRCAYCQSREGNTDLGPVPPAGLEALSHLVLGLESDRLGPHPCSKPMTPHWFQQLLSLGHWKKLSLCGVLHFFKKQTWRMWRGPLTITPTPNIRLQRVALLQSPRLGRVNTDSDLDKQTLNEAKRQTKGDWGH